MQRRSLATAARSLAKATLGAAWRTWLRWSGAKVGVALLYHGVRERARPREEELVPTVPAALFARQVAHLRRHYRVVPASRLQVEASRRRRGEPLPVAITFDDDDPGYLRHVLPILERQRVVATFFLNGASLEQPRWFWWERLQEVWDRGLVDEELARELPRSVGVASRRTPTSLEAMGAAFERLAPEALADAQAALAARLGDGAQGERLAATGIEALAASGQEVGFHTLRHDFLPRLDDAALWRALTEGREALASLSSQPLSTLAYPNGGWDMRVTAAAARAGFTVAYTTEKRPVAPASAPLALGRITPPPQGVAALSFELVRTLGGHPRG